MTRPPMSEAFASIDCQALNVSLSADGERFWAWIKVSDIQLGFDCIAGPERDTPEEALEACIKRALKRRRPRPDNRADQLILKIRKAERNGRHKTS